LGSVPARAAVLAEEDFESYAPGQALFGQNGGFGWAGAWGPPGSNAVIAIATNTGGSPLNFTPPGGLVIAGGDSAFQVSHTADGVNQISAARQLASPISQTFYVRYLVRLREGLWNQNNTFAIHCGTNATATTNLNFGLRSSSNTNDSNAVHHVMVRNGTGNLTTTAHTNAATGGQISAGTDYFLVARLNYSAQNTFDSIHLWLNPGATSEADKPQGDAWLILSAGSGLPFVSHLLLRAASLHGITTPRDIVMADEIKVGTAWNDMVPPAGGLTVNAGQDQNLMFPPATNRVAVSLAGTVTADVGITYTSRWSQVSGPGTVTFATATNVSTTAVIEGAPGVYVLQLEAGNASNFASDTLTVTVSAHVPDTTPPQIIITSPPDGQTLVAGAAVVVTANITDNVAVQAAELYMDGVFRGTDVLAPYSWSVSGLALGFHTLAVRAVDAAGNAATNEVTITIAETSPAVIAAETFETYSVGTLNGANGGAGWSGAWSTGAAVNNVIDTAGNPLSFTPLGGRFLAGGARAVRVTTASSGIYSVRTLATPLARTFYVRYLARLAAGSMATNCTFALHCSDAGAAANASLTNSLNIGFRRDSTSGATNFMVRQGIVAPLASGAMDKIPALDQTYCVVARYVFSGGAFTRIDGWLDPGYADQNNPAVTATYAAGLTSISTLFFRSAALSGNFDVDELVVGDTWEAVVPGDPPKLAVTRLGGGLQLTWSSPDCALEQASQLSSPDWLEVPNATSPRLVAATNPQQYFRLRQTPAVAPPPPADPLVLWAATNFPNLNAGAVPAYKDSARNALAINTASLPAADLGKFAAATATFTGAAGSYHLTLTTLTERDGECTFRVLINGVQAGQFTNPRIYPSTTEYTEHSVTFSNITVAAGATIRVEFNSNSNGLVPEGADFAYARGRWRKLVLTPAVSAPSGAWLESGGLVVMEAENTASPLGLWVKVNPGNPIYVIGASGTGHLEFTGNGPSGGSANSPLSYQFKISQGGVYRLYIRARKRLEGAASDLCNDGYVRMTGNYTSGGSVALSLLQANTKFFGGAENSWAWAAQLDDANDVKWSAEYNFLAGETYTLVISGRSQRWNMDRIVLRRAGVADSTWQNATESARAP